MRHLIRQACQQLNEQPTRPASPHKRQPIRPSVRFAVLSRDHYRCVCCGRSAEVDGVKLEVDHRIPVAKGGTNRLDNLQTLCMTCNRGKGITI